jgi:GNAT superfamily N-acetyltransferase
MPIEYKPAPSLLAAEYIALRSLTRQNPITADTLRSLGITAESWAKDIEAKQTQGFIALSGEQMVGYCFGARSSGEVLVLAVRPAYEGQGIGQRLLALVVEQLKLQGHTRLFLACSANPAVRSHGFYRRLGWRSTGALDKHADEVLEFTWA